MKTTTLHQELDQLNREFEQIELSLSIARAAGDKEAIASYEAQSNRNLRQTARVLNKMHGNPSVDISHQIEHLLELASAALARHDNEEFLRLSGRALELEEQMRSEQS